MSRAMKDSGIPWIGEIPKEWSILQLKRLKDKSHPYPIGDGDHGSIKPEDYIDEGIPYIRVQNMTWGGDLLLDNIAYISEEVNDRNLKSELHPKDILIAKTGATIGKTAIIPDSIPKANTTSSVAKVTISKQQWYKYVFYVLGSDVCITQMWLKAQQKSAQPGFNIDELVDFILPLPSLSEQKMIASFLDRKCAEVDEMIALQEQIIEELKAYKQSVITEAVTKGLNPDVPMKDSGIEWIGQIPEHWEVNKVSRNYYIQLGKMLQPNQQNSTDELCNYLCAANVGKNVLKLEPLKQMWISENEREQYAVKKGDLLVVEGGDVASCDVVTEDVSQLYIQNALHRVRAKSNQDVRLLRYLLIVAKHTGHIDLICNKATISHFTKEKFEALHCVVIPQKEQKEILLHLDTKCTEIDNLISIKLSKIDSLKEYKKSIIYEYVTGKREVEYGE